MKVFMLGWEFPPYISGGLGTACHGLTRGLDEIGVSVSFVLPTSVGASESGHVKLQTPTDLPSRSEEAAGGPGAGPERFRHVEFHQVAAALQPYRQPQPETASQGGLEALEAEPGDSPAPVAAESPEAREADRQATEAMPPGALDSGMGDHYGGDLMGQVHRYARMAVELALHESFDVVHAHDWMTYPAGLAVAAATHKPLVIHVHSTEFDRSGLNVNQQVYDIERMGMHGADKVVCVSHLTRSIVKERYGVPEDKLEVVYNAVELPDNGQWQMKPIRQDEKLVLFLGRVTMQKGPEYFLQAARKVVDRYPNVRFVVAGSGDMINRCIEMVASLRLGKHVVFTGFLRGDDVNRVFQMADLYVMPSVSEPFGIAPLEALSHNVPVLISRQSGVSEILTHVLKVDFWDTDEMANKILAVLRHAPLQKTLTQHGQIDLRKLSWKDSAARVVDVYKSVVRK